MTKRANTALWLTTPNHLLVEIALANGHSTFVLDVEHGLFDLTETDKLVSFCRHAGADVYAKVACGGAYDVQQMLDRGCNGVIIPHVDGVDHARTVCEASKYPPLGSRSFDGGRCVGFSAAPPGYFRQSNKDIMALPMIETNKGLTEIENILSLPSVDGVFVGPYDLSLSSGRGRYRKEEADHQDLVRISEAAAAADKSWWMPAWSREERITAIELGASCLVVAHELGFFKDGLRLLSDELAQLGFASRE